MPKINVVVEGQTEETFIHAVLNPYILARNNAAYVMPLVVQTKRVFTGQKWTGGLSSYKQFRADVVRALGDRGATCVTSMIDLFHLPEDFPGFEKTRDFQSSERVRILEEAMCADLVDARFLPYISTHEFEALLLSNPEAVVSAAGGREGDSAALSAVVATFRGPEEVNGVNPPSYRIRSILPNYNKVVHGASAAMETGINTMKSTCKHFRDWLDEVEVRLS